MKQLSQWDNGAATTLKVMGFTMPWETECSIMLSNTAGQFGVQGFEGVMDMGKWVKPSNREEAEMRQAAEVVEAARQRDEDRRGHTRLALNANVSLESNSNFFAGFTENISEGGVFVSTLSPPSEGETVVLKIKVAGAGEVAVPGVVRWLRTGEDGHYTGCGVQFEHLTEQAKHALDHLVKSLGREPLFYEV